MHESVPLAADDEAVAVGKESHGPPVHPFDIAVVALVVHDAGRSRRIAQQHFEMVLQTVQPIKAQLPRRGPEQTRNVLVGLLPRIHPYRTPVRRIAAIKLHDRILLAGLRIFERIVLGIEPAGEAVHVILLHAALVEPQVGYLPAVGRPGERPRERKLLLVDPIGQAVDNMVEPAVEGQLPLRSGRRIGDEQVASAHESHPAAVGRKLRLLLRPALRKSPQRSVLPVVNPVLGGKRMPVNRLDVRGQQQPSFVRAQDVIRKLDPGLGGRSVEQDARRLAGAVREA